LNSQGIVTGGKIDGKVVSEPSLDGTESTSKMDRSLAHSIAWRAITNWASQILSWASLLIVVRLLAPADFGIAAMAIIIFPYLRYLSEIGIPSTVVTFRDMSEDQLAQLNTIGLLFSLACFGIAAALAHPLAAFFRIPGLALVTIIACLALVPQGFRAVSEGLLNKDMRFGLLSWFEAIRSIVAAVTTLVLAYLGFRYWALILGNLAATLVRSALIVAVRPQRFAIPRVSTIRKELIFGWHVLVSVLAWSAYERLDNLTAGRVLGQAALGFYGMAWNLANVPLEKVTSLVTTVIPSYLAAVQNEPASLRRYLRTLTETMALATFPATIGLALVAGELVPVAMGNKWHDAVLPLEILGVYAGIRSVVALLPKVLTAVGNARFVMWNDLRALVILPIAFVIGSRWGIGGIACGWVAAYPLIALPLYWKTFKTIGMSTQEYVRGLRPALDGTLVMAIAVILLKWKAPLGHSLLLRLVSEIVVGGAAYLATLFLLHRERLIGFWQMAKSIRKHR
jgi:teichuronic acid exporter